MCGRTSERCPFCIAAIEQLEAGHLGRGVFLMEIRRQQVSQRKLENKIMEDEICQERK